MEFKERLTAPTKSNKYYYSSNVFYKSNYGLPNCTCYAWGRFYELSGQYPRLCTANAENWYKYNKDGYSRGKTPKLGAIIVWSKGIIGKASDGAGHVAVVEKINSDGSILVSQSGYKSSLFWTTTYKSGYKKSGYKFEGFIYNPISFTSNIKYPGTLIKKGSKGTYVTQVQNRLNELGYNCGKVDGIFGNNTRAAVNNFQKANGLTQDGIVGNNTWSKLFN